MKIRDSITTNQYKFFILIIFIAILGLMLRLYLDRGTNNHQYDMFLELRKQNEENLHLTLHTGKWSWEKAYYRGLYQEAVLVNLSLQSVQSLNLLHDYHRLIQQESLAMSFYHMGAKEKSQSLIKSLSYLSLRDKILNQMSQIYHPTITDLQQDWDHLKRLFELAYLTNDIVWQRAYYLQKNHIITFLLKKNPSDEKRKALLSSLSKQHFIMELSQKGLHKMAYQLKKQLQW